ncbi:hypothetical protein [Acetobacter cerevisiae]|uniref:Uncharacterized protein n=1 Tax=Acetobacter cerevisiae TaxID=178900 RepID=A0A149R350_9PROT|nr:hypothetical protein [Acetobacter cerevisiae]KXV04000.1 hypothetical protein AD928_00095 [Acetobacter cerevisiae]GBQ11028.1 hypothetical protein AA14362_2669 [Acetobacter cerevisiae DSM 14362]
MMHPFYDNKINLEGIKYLFELLSAYQMGTVSLPVLADKLDTARSGLIFPEKEWLDTYCKFWGAIEECNALALDAGQTSVLPEHQQFLDDTVIKLQRFFSNTFPVQNQSKV